MVGVPPPYPPMAFIVLHSGFFIFYLCFLWSLHFPFSGLTRPPPPQSVNTTGGFLRHRHRLRSENILSGEGVSLDDSDTPQAPLPFGISICTLHFDIPGRGLPFMTFLTPLHSILIFPFVISHCREGSFRHCHFNPRPPSLLVFSFCHSNTREGSCRFF